MFITFEGPDGSGKTTVLESLRQYLDSKDFEYVFTREPGTPNSPEAQQIRNIILDSKNNLTPMAEAILFTADRRLHLDTLIIPALKANKVVLCDRYVDSSLAYQGGGKELGIDKVLKLNEAILDGYMPDLTIFFDLTPDESAKRVDQRAAKDRMELEGVEFRQRVYDSYKELMVRFPDRIVSVDASMSKEDVFEAVKAIINKSLNL